MKLIYSESISNVIWFQFKSEKSTNKMKENQENHKGQDFKYQLAGWILFILCAIFFIASSIKNRDTLTFIGAGLFLIANIVFLMSLVRKIKKARGDKKT